jgi:hypothetical protein
MPGMFAEEQLVLDALPLEAVLQHCSASVPSTGCVEIGAVYYAPKDRLGRRVAVEWQAPFVPHTRQVLRKQVRGSRGSH